MVYEELIYVVVSSNAMHQGIEWEFVGCECITGSVFKGIHSYCCKCMNGCYGDLESALHWRCACLHLHVTTIINIYLARKEGGANLSDKGV